MSNQEAFKAVKAVPTLKDQVSSLLTKAETADKSEDALRFSQAALNAAHTKSAIGG